MRLAPVVRWSARTAAGLLLAALVAAGPADAGPPGQSKAYGKSLTEWTTLYLEWYLGGYQPDHVGKVQFLPLPNGEQESGTGTPMDPAVYVGELNVTLKPGTPFVLPVAVWYGAKYEDGSVDPVLPDAVFTQSDVLVTVDGKTTIDSDRDDLTKYYVPVTEFDPMIPFPAPPVVGVVFFQGLGFVPPPLSVGTHTITLSSEIIIDPSIGLSVRYENTWYITVKK